MFAATQFLDTFRLDRKRREGKLKGNKYKKEGKIKERTRNIYKVIKEKSSKSPEGSWGWPLLQRERERCIHVAGSLGKATALCVAKVCILV